MAEKKINEEINEEIKEEIKSDEKQMRASTESNRRKKAERREAKAARKAANKIEEKKSKPNNLLIAVLIFGVVIGMFAFIAGYNYYQKEASVQTYFENNSYGDMYNNVAFDENSTLKMAAEDNTLKVVLKVNEDVSEEDLEEYTSGDTWEYLQEMGAYLLTTIKPETRAFSADVKVGVKQGDEMVAYKRMTYSEAKDYIKELEEKAEEESEAADEDADADAEAAEEASDDAADAEAAEEAAEETDDSDDSAEIEVEADDADDADETEEKTE